MSPSPWQPFPADPPPAPPAPVPAPAPAPPKNIAEARAQGVAGPGLLVTAPLVPQTGPIPGQPGDFVTTVLKGFWESKTIKSLRNAIGLAIFIAIGVISTQVIEAKGNWEVINWHTTLDAAGAAGLLSLAFGYAAWLKVRDNDPIK